MRKWGHVLVIGTSALFFRDLAWGALVLDISTGTPWSNSTSATTISTGTTNTNELFLIFCAGNTSTPKSPTTTASLTLVNIATATKTGYVTTWVGCNSASISAKTFTCNTNAAASQLVYVQGVTGSACSPLYPQGGIGSFKTNTTAALTTVITETTTTIANSWQFGAGGDASNGDTLVTDANETYLMKYTTDTFTANSEWVIRQNNTTSSVGTVVISSVTGVTSNGSSIYQMAVEVIPTGAPFAFTLAPTSITRTAFTANATVYTGGTALSDEGLCYNTAGNPTTSDTCISNGSTEGTFSANFTGLSNSSLYHVRAYGTNANGTTYGADVPFATLWPDGITTTPGVGRISTDTGVGSITTAH
jgi:hypothetical protein